MLYSMVAVENESPSSVACRAIEAGRRCCQWRNDQSERYGESRGTDQRVDISASLLFNRFHMGQHSLEAS
jgi:hypothetical protein